MTDKELLELAAKAARLDFVPSKGGSIGTINGVWHKPWNPLTDDGDALRLAVKLRADIYLDENSVIVVAEEGDRLSESYDDAGSPDAATRRAIVRVAASIGKTMP